MFDRIAPRYDLLNHLLSAGIDTRWRKRAVDFLDLKEPARILDLCTGTADLLIEALGRDPSHRGMGADFSREMLIRAARKLARRGMSSRSGLVCGDGEALPFARGSFDAALLAFGIRNIADPSSALREVRQALRPGGRLVVLEFSMPRGPLGVLYRVYFREILPRVGALVSGDGSAYSYLPASVARFPGPEEFAALMEGAGFGSISWRELSGGIAYLYRGQA
jgi:demethylmenaquinone methyltransferase/2-methoxy-6-polyprenyl-1,4-benzoquinol methylase